MSGFAAAWLDLREPHDARARSVVLEERLVAWAKGREVLRVVDLASGTGSNLRHLGPRLPVPQRWLLVEIDPALVAAGRRRLARVGEEWRYRRADLRSELEAVLAEPTDLVTCSALLDFVSASWLERLVRRVGERGCAFLAALTYDGRAEFDPPHPFDRTLVDLLNRHQRTDKGFGPALGPDGAYVLERALAGLPGTVGSAASDWVVGREGGRLQRRLIGEWAQVATSLAPAAQGRIAAWRADRLACLADAGSLLRIGHRDVLHLPA